MKNKITKPIMITTVFYFGIAGLFCSFLPEELLSFFSLESPKLLVLGTQILGSLYLGFGMMNWMTKNSIMGGIYNRPIVFGNFLHFFIGTIVLLKSIDVFSNEQLTALIVISILYTVFALSFGYVLFQVNK
jgi:hypothetical protein